VFSFVLSFVSLVNAEKGTLGFDLGVQTGANTCKATADFTTDLQTLKPYSNTVRIYSLSQCNAFMNIMPAIIKSGFKIVLGIWPDLNGNMDAEKAALQSGLKQFGADNIVAITVASEALYRKDYSAETLAGLINDIRTLLNSLGFGYIPVGTADTWNEFIDLGNAPVINACDIVYLNAFPYWQGQTIENATSSVFDSIMQAAGVIQSVNPKASFAVGETGWPTGGANYESAVPSVANAENFWDNGVMGLIQWGVNVFFFEAYNEPWKADSNLNGTGATEGEWGAFTVDRVLKYPLN